MKTYRFQFNVKIDSYGGGPEITANGLDSLSKQEYHSRKFVSIEMIKKVKVDILNLEERKCVYELVNEMIFGKAKL